MKVTQRAGGVVIEHSGVGFFATVDEAKFLQLALAKTFRAPIRMTTSSAARLVGVSQSTMLRAVQAKKIKSMKTPGGHFRLDPEAVVRFFKVDL